MGIEQPKVDENDGISPELKKLEEERAVIEKLFPEFFSDPKRRFLLEHGYQQEKPEDPLLEYAHDETVETSNYYACVIEYCDRFHDENGDSSRKNIDLVFRKKDGNKEKHTRVEYWKSFDGRSRSFSNVPNNVLGFNGKLKVIDSGNDKITITITYQTRDNDLVMSFSADLSMGGKIEELKK